MFKLNDTVVYGNSQVCIVKNISTPDFIKTEDKYYWLQPICNKSSTLYVKIDSQNVVMRPTISTQEAKKIIDNFTEIEPMYDNNAKTREKTYEDVMHSCDCLQWFKMLKGIHNEETNRLKNGKKLNNNDKRSQEKVENCIAAELSVVFNIPISQAKINLQNVFS